jgi:hypothetical protein
MTGVSYCAQTLVVMGTCLTLNLKVQQNLCICQRYGKSAYRFSLLPYF